MSKRATVTKANGRIVEVKNLGWLLRNWRSVCELHWVSQPPREGYPNLGSGLFKAYMDDGSIYRIEYYCFSVWCNFIDRPVFRGLPVTVNGIKGTV